MFAVKLVGNTLLCWAANIVPASAATAAPKLIAMILSKLVLTVIASAASSSSRMARHPSPVRDLSRLRIRTMSSAHAISAK